MFSVIILLRWVVLYAGLRSHEQGAKIENGFLTANQCEQRQDMCKKFMMFALFAVKISYF